MLLISVESKQIKTKVVILGAGASGISAAKSLSKAGMQDYVIVDAQSFIGGKLLIDGRFIAIESWWAV